MPESWEVKDLLKSMNYKLEKMNDHLSKITEILKDTLDKQEAERIYEVWTKKGVLVGTYNSYKEAQGVHRYLGRNEHYIKITKHIF